MLSAHILKKEVELNTELTELLEVFKGIASSQFRILEKKKERFAKFMDAFEEFFQMIDFSSIQHPFARGQGKLGIIMVTSDEGFMGGLNTQVINTALDYSPAEKPELIIIGSRGAGYLKELGLNFLEFPGVSNEEIYESALKLKDFVIKEGLAGRFSRLILVYPKPISFTVQKPEVLTILPCSELFKKRQNIIEEKEHIIVESPLGSIIEYLVGAWIAEKLFEVLEDAKLAEFSARTVHLEEIHQVLQQKSRQLQFQYFRSRHELVDKSMRESFSSRTIRRNK